MKPLKIVEERKNQLLKNLVLVSILSIGISLLANFFSKKYDSNNLLLWIGLSLIFIVIIAYLVSFYKSKECVIKEKALFVTDMEGRFVPIKRYGFSQDMNVSLLSVFNENSTFEDKWIKAFKGKRVIDHNNKDIIGFVGEEAFSSFLQSNRYLAPLFASIVGLIPNCASSLILAELYIGGNLSFGAIIAGLLVNAGLGFMVLLKNRKSATRVPIILSICFLTAVATGYITCLVIGF